MRRKFIWALVLALASFGALLLYGHARSHPEDMPWTALDLGRPIGAFTGRKLAGLSDDGPRCLALLTRAGVRYTALPARRAGPQCGYDHAVRLNPGGALAIGYRPADLIAGCAVAAALALWEWHVVQPAAQRLFGRAVARIDHYGGYNCRRLYGRDAGAWSEHARANAIDIAGFTLEGGQRILVARDWGRAGREAAFLEEVRDGACRLFSTVLSPDYNQAHRDHLHFDMAARGSRGWRACR
jgi:hypothetical protein